MISYRCYVLSKSYLRTLGRNYSTLKNKKIYSDTLLLPKTSFPLRPEPVVGDEAQKITEALWDWQVKQKSRPTWSLLDGPPYTNGSLHMGHALNKILKDIVNRYKLLLGFRINYTPGFDCHGLPLELKAVESLRTSRPDQKGFSPNEIRDAARKTAEEGVELQTREFKRLSILADWKNAWRTMDHQYEIKQLEHFCEMVENKLVYRQRKPVFFSPSSRTALAEAEIEYRDDHTSRSVYVGFDISYQSPVLKQVMGRCDPLLPLRAIIWTTTPWTLPANQAIAVKKDARYSLVQAADRDIGSQTIYIFASERLHVLKDLLGLDNLEIIAELTGEDLASSCYRHDFNEAQLPIFTADHVTIDSGSGLVHTAPSHGLEDFLVYNSYFRKDSQSKPIELIDIVNDLGEFNIQGEEGWKKCLNQKGVLQDGNGEVISMLQEQGRLIGKEVKIRHKYPYDWRTKKPVITKTTDQWFLDLQKIRLEALSTIQKIKFIPESSKTRLESFLKSRSEWCISRQRPWGVPIPILYSLEDGKPLLNPSAIKWALNVLRVKGTDHWWNGPVTEYIPPGVQGEYRKGEDTMDVWFDSGVAWSMLDETPADMVLEGSDQHRGWFQSLLLTHLSQEHEREKDLVYRSVVTHGFTLDQRGRKMSKSLGNIISPIELIDGNSAKKQPKFGIDVLRFWAASVDFTKDVNIGTDRLSRLSETVRKIRSTARFLLGTVHREQNHRSSHESSIGEYGPLERYMLHLLHEFQTAIKSAYEEMDLKQVVQLITIFTTNTLSSFYFETIKDTLYNDLENSLERQRVLSVLSNVLSVYQFAFAPILPHLAEEIFAHKKNPDVSFKGRSIFEELWPESQDSWEDKSTFEMMQPLLSLRSCIFRELEILRKEKRIKSSEGAELVVDLSSADESHSASSKILTVHGEVLPRLFGLSDVSICKTPSAASTILGLASPSWKHEFQWKRDESDPGIKMFLLPAWRSECPRCWKFTVEDGYETCDRCLNVLTELSKNSSQVIKPPTES